MSCDQDEFLGNEMTQNVYISLQCDATTKPTDFALLGGVNNISGGTEVATVDVTTEQWGKVIAGKKTMTPTISGFVKRSLTGAKLDELIDWIDTADNPAGWIQLQVPRLGGITRITSVPVLFTGCPITGTTNEATTFDLSSESRGTPIFETV